MPTRPQYQSRQVRCGLSRRLAAVLYDTLIVTGLLLIAAAVASPFDNGGQQAFRDPLFTLYLLAVWYAYVSLCWINGGMTVGMRAWKVILLANDGEIGWKICVTRFLTAWLSAAFLGAGFIWSLFDQQQRSWHDISSRSGLFRV